MVELKQLLSIKQQVLDLERDLRNQSGELTTYKLEQLEKYFDLEKSIGEIIEVKTREVAEKFDKKAGDLSVKVNDNKVVQAEQKGKLHWVYMVITSLLGAILGGLVSYFFKK